MKFEKDLLTQKSLAKTVIGILCFTLIILWISIIFYYTKKHFDVFDITYLLALFLIGALFYLEGKGIPVARIIGKAFVLIDEEQITMKRSVFYKKETILWEEIKRIEYRPNYFLFTKKDDSLFPLRLKPLTFKINKEILKSIKIVSKSKGLNIERMNDFKRKQI